ncbi:hypothetical protein HanIR_Chr04g0196491 [Helianthus annuus]|nr:hypothetical protein HanIR_Chr04g0196491 [Helianthus annuus]
MIRGLHVCFSKLDVNAPCLRIVEYDRQGCAVLGSARLVFALPHKRGCLLRPVGWPVGHTRRGGPCSGGSQMRIVISRVRTLGMDPVALMCRHVRVAMLRD